MELNLVFVIVFLSMLVAFYIYLTSNNKFFEKFPIPCLPVEPLFGSYRRLAMKQISFNEFVRYNYELFPDAKMFGMFEMLTPMFVIRDPELVKRITVKDFDHFINHRQLISADSYNSNNYTVMFSKVLFNLTGQRWRDVRTTLSPTFTGSKMRQMFTMIVECSENMVQSMANPAAQEYEMKDLFVSFANDVIASCAFGVRINSFQDKQNVFLRYGKDISNFSRWKVFFRMMGFQLFPQLMARLQLDIFDRKHVEFFTDLFRQSVLERETHGTVRPDLIQLLMQASKGKLRHQPQEREEVESFAAAKESNDEMALPKTTVPLSESEMVAQCLLFFLAGFDTLATTITFLVYEITIASDIQQRLYEEIRQVSESLDGKSLTYDALQGMRYLDMVVAETVRKWNPAPGTDRLCNKDYKISDEPEIIIPKGSVVFIPITGLHYDPNFYPDPDRFDPERFNEENRQNIPLGAYIPFGIGPRNCIASRFALMEVKTIVYYLLLNYEFKRSARTQIPVKLAKGLTPLKPEKGIYVQLNPRKRI